MVTVVGSVLVDIMSYGERIPVPGETVTGYKYQITPGGKGANQAAAAARLGVPTYFIGKMSGCDRLAEVLWEGFSWAGVNVEHVQIVEDMNCGVGVIMVDKMSQNLITIVLGPNALMTPEDVDAKMDVIRKSKIMATEFGIPLQTSEYATIHCRKAGLITLVTPGPAVPMSDAFYRSTSVIVPNETEAQILTGIKVGDAESAGKAAAIFHKRGVENVIITMGCKGAFVSEGKRRDLLGSVKVKPLDSTGAGDAFIGGLACGLAEGKDIFESAAYANVVAGLSVTRPGTMRSMASRQEVELFIKGEARAMNYRTPVISDQARARIDALKADSLNVIQEVCVERARYLTETYRSTEAEPLIIRRAKALANVLEKMTIFIRPQELIVGNQASRLRAAPIFPEYCVEWISDEIDQLAKRPGDVFVVDPRVRVELLEICAWWNGRTLSDRCAQVLPEEVKKAYETGVLSARGNMTSGDGHIMLDFPKVLAVGVNGIIAEAKSELASLSLVDPESFHKKLVLESVIIAYEGVLAFARRYAALATSLAATEKDPARRGELERIAEICTVSPSEPARGFREAIQTVWFMHLISQIESNGHSMSLGRFDQYMLGCFTADKEKGTLTDAQAVELLAALWVKMFGVTKIRPWNHTRFSGGGPTYQNLTLGGVSPEGRDATNDLTMLCLDSVALTRLPQPNVSARLHPGAPPEYLHKCAEVIRLGFGMPAMHNDELMIPSLLSRGVKLEDANNYAIVGCIEPIIPGKHGYRAAGMSFTNFAKILEMTLNGGRDPKTGHRLCPDDRDLGTFASFADLLDAFEKQMRYYVRLRVEGEHAIDYSIEELIPEPFCTGLVQDCIRRGRTPKEGGAVYDMVTGPETGVTNVGNALAALKKLVFEEKVLSGQQLKEALDTNFNGLQGEQVRQLLLNKAPKFGNDDEYVDSLTCETYMIFIRELEKYHTTRFGRGPIGGISYPCTATISGNVPSGLPVGATPDGRRDGEALAEGCSPFHGTDRLGPTAVAKSVARMPTIRITGGNLLNQKILPSSVSGEEGLAKLQDLVRTFFEMKGWHIQFNVVNPETLRSAQKEPEKYRDLVVRVAGYSALFTSLEPDTQDDIIARTTHSLG